MKTRMFNFDPVQSSEHFAREGYVHIRQGVTEEFYQKMVMQVEEYMSTRVMKEFAIGDKQQARYDFPEDGDYIGELCRTVGKVCGLNPQDMLLSERHIKAYEATAEPEPHAHKDRFASQISVGISVHVREGSTLILYPYDMTSVNPFNTSVQLRASLSPERYPEPALKMARRVEINDSPRDVIIFRGHSIWHLRAKPALTTMLYLKLNAFNCDPLGEDSRTEEHRKRTQMAATLNDQQLDQFVPLIGRRVDYMHRYYNRDWTEVLGVVLWGEKHFTVDEEEFRALQLCDGRRNVGAVINMLNGSVNRADLLKKFRRLATRGVIDLIASREN